MYTMFNPCEILYVYTKTDDNQNETDRKYWNQNHPSLFFL